MAIAMRGHPARAGKMAVMHRAGTIGFPGSVQAKQDLHDLAPVSAFFGSVKYP